MVPDGHRNDLENTLVQVQSDHATAIIDDADVRPRCFTADSVLQQHTLCKPVARR